MYRKTTPRTIDAKQFAPADSDWPQGVVARKEGGRYAYYFDGAMGGNFVPLKPGEWIFPDCDGPIDDAEFRQTYIST